ncbi:MAG: hypothetical protein M1358_07950 [Chloroflexi bacterium]|nr:hypothetical protein [Chloroflexota bacterium]
MDTFEVIEQAIGNTRVRLYPKQNLATFGTTNINYFIITSLLDQLCAVREGKVVAEMPRILTPHYLPTFEGFGSHGKDLAEWLRRSYGSDTPMLRYAFRHEPKEMVMVSNSLDEVTARVRERVDRDKDTLCGILEGAEETWNISVWKLALDMAARSLSNALTELDRNGLLDVEGGVPKHARFVIDRMFEDVEKDRASAPKLVRELQRWGLFEDYQDRFFELFKRSRR